MKRPLLDECFRVKGRERFYLSMAEIQRDLDEFMAYYNITTSSAAIKAIASTAARPRKRCAKRLASRSFQTCVSIRPIRQPSTRHPTQPRGHRYRVRKT